MSDVPSVMGKRESHVLVAALTYRRPFGIVKLLESLCRQSRRPERPYKLTIMVVDNDPGCSAREFVDNFAVRSDILVLYVNEPRRGIPIARNAALDAAPRDTDYFCFIDDDEWPSETWLDELIKVSIEGSADIVYGPVDPVYPAEAPAFFVESHIFDRRRHADLSVINYAATNNVMFKYDRVTETGVRFEERMRHTGGTDYLFFRQLICRGLTVVWADKAYVYDSIPLSRMNWRWVSQRQYRIGNTFALSEAVEGGVGSKTWCLLSGFARVMGGIGVFPLIVWSKPIGMRGFSQILRGLGMIAGIAGHRYSEYGNI